MGNNTTHFAAKGGERFVPPPRPKHLLVLVEDELRPLIEEELADLRNDASLSRSDRICRLAMLKLLLQSRTTGVQRGLKEFFELTGKVAGGGNRKERTAAQAHADAESAFVDGAG